MNNTLSTQYYLALQSVAFEAQFAFWHESYSIHLYLGDTPSWVYFTLFFDQLSSKRCDVAWIWLIDIGIEVLFIWLSSRCW